MKILFFVRKFWPGVGGVEKHCLEIGKRLVEKGNEVTVVAEGTGGQREVGGEENPWGIRIYRIPISAGERLKKFQIWFWLWNHRVLIREADIIHCHDVFFWYIPFKLLHPRKKVFSTFHGWEGIYPPRWKARLIRKISEKLSLGNVCVGDFICKWYGTKADFVTYGAVDQIQSAKFKVQSYNSKFKVLFIGRLEEDTGLPIYLKAIEKFTIYNPSSGSGQVFQFTIVFLGDGGLRKEAEKYGEVKGFVENVSSHIQEADFIFASGYLSILEAMINKKLVFAVYDNPLKGDYLKMTPFAKWIIICSSSLELAEKVNFYLCHQPEEKNLVDNAYNWAKGQSWEKLSDKYLLLWTKSIR